MILEQVIHRPSPNFSNTIIIPKLIIIHWTAGALNGSLAWLCNKKSFASAHFLIGVNCQIYQLVDTNKKAWHAGESETIYGKYCNNYAIGIELEGPPSKLGLDGWEESQLIITAQLCKELVKLHSTIEAITDHSTVSPGRKFDVKSGIGEDKFPWNYFVTMTGINDLII
jgi:N-acetyl-anhydromuramyl-L-alanine amidase AmpD